MSTVNNKKFAIVCCGNTNIELTTEIELGVSLNVLNKFPVRIDDYWKKWLG